MEQHISGFDIHGWTDVCEHPRALTRPERRNEYAAATGQGAANQKEEVFAVREKIRMGMTDFICVGVELRYRRRHSSRIRNAHQPPGT